MSDLHLGLDAIARRPGRSLEDALREGIRAGRLAAGLRLPGSRSLAADLGVARGTVVQAYAQLAAEGWLRAERGSGTRVAAHPPYAEPSGPPGPAAAPPGMTLDLRPGRPDLGSFPRTAWARAIRRALATAANETLDYPDPAGLPELRVAVAGYLARTRGVHTTPETVVITAGFTSGLALLGRALHRRGARRIATEDPGLSRHRSVLRAAGLTVEPAGRPGAAARHPAGGRGGGRGAGAGDRPARDGRPAR